MRELIGYTVKVVKSVWDELSIYKYTRIFRSMTKYMIVISNQKASYIRNSSYISRKQVVALRTLFRARINGERPSLNLPANAPTPTTSSQHVPFCAHAWLVVVRIASQRAHRIIT